MPLPLCISDNEEEDAGEGDSRGMGSDIRRLISPELMCHDLPTPPQQRYGATSIPPKVAKKEATSDPHDDKDLDHQKLLEEATRRVMNLSSEIRGLTKSSVELMAQKAHQIRTLESCEKQCQDLAMKVQAMEGLRSQQAKAKKQTKTKTKNKAKSKRGMGEVLSRAANAILRNEPSPAEQRNGDGDGAKGLPPLPPIHLPKKEPQNCRVIPYPMVAAAACQQE
mgnify:CR=1 FL=1